MNPVLSFLSSQAARHLRSLQAGGQQLNLLAEAPLRPIGWSEELMAEQAWGREISARPAAGLSWTQVEELSLNDE